ncbi:MAG: hypothetical protein Q9192_007625 [Flavoplaca navasiana]
MEGRTRRDELYRYACYEDVAQPGQTSRALQGKTYLQSAETVFSDAEHNSADYLRYVVAYASNPERPRDVYNSLMMIPLYLYGFSDNAIEVSFATSRTIHQLWSIRNNRLNLFYLSLASIAKIQENQISSRGTDLLDQVWEFKSQIDAWQTESSVNHLMWSLLIEAEVADLDQNTTKLQFFTKEVLHAERIQTVISLPILRGKSDLLGVLYLEGQPNSFSDRNVGVLQLFCNQVSISIFNALLFKKIHKVSAANASMIESQKVGLAEARDAELKAKVAETEAMKSVREKEEAAKAKSSQRLARAANSAQRRDWHVEITERDCVAFRARKLYR